MICDEGQSGKFNDNQTAKHDAEETDSNTVRRGIPQASGVYVKGSVEGVDTVFTIDTGASATILSRKVFSKIHPDKQPKLNECGNRPFIGPMGGLIEICGKAEVCLCLGSVSLKMEIAVADLQDDCLLGADILMGLPEGPFNLLLKESCLEWNGTTIPCIKVGSPTSCKVTCTDTCTIPGYSEAIVEANVTGVTDADEGSVIPMREVIVEPSPHFKDKNRLVMATSLVTLRKCQTVYIRVLNPFKHNVVLHKGEILGRTEQSEEVISWVNEEDPSESANYSAIRRVKIETPEVSPAVRLVGDSHDIGEQNTPFLRNTVEEMEKTVPEHLKDLYERTVVDKSDSTKVTVAELLTTHSETFSRDDDDLGCTHLATHEIDTGKAKPIKQPPHRTPLAYQGKDKEAIEKMKDKGVIRESTSPWASPVVLIPKKDGTLRVCIDYRRVNQVTKKDGFPLPNMRDCLDSVAGSAYFSTLDLTSGYHQVPVAEADIPKTAFVTKHGLFECLTLPFGLCNGPSTFQRVMELALRGLQWITCLIYIDDIIVFAKTEEEHLARLGEILNRIQSANLKLKPGKCHLLQTEVLFLGHLLSGEGVKPNPANIDRVLGWSTPTKPKEVRQFLGLATYYRRFIKDFAKIAKPLSELTGTSVEFKWTDACQQSFDALKHALTGPEIMAYPLDVGEFILDTDACDVSIGAVLSQVQDGKEKVVAYASRTLNKAERNYCVTDKELLAVKHFIEHFRHYLLGRHFIVRSDHQALQWLFSLKEPKGRIARWLTIMAEFGFEVEYRAGKRYGNATLIVALRSHF